MRTRTLSPLAWLSRVLSAALIAGAALVPPLHAAEGGEPAKKKVSLQEVYDRGRVAFHTGDLATAREMFATVLKHNPKHALSQHYLAQIRAAEEARGGNATVERKMQSVVLEDFAVDGDTIGTTVQYLVRLTEKSSGGEFKPNIVLKGLSEGQLAKEMTFSLNRVPAAYALKTIGDMVGVQFRYDEHAIVGSPRPREGAAAPASAPPATPDGGDGVR
jgi:hypothetical protein